MSFTKNLFCNIYRGRRVLVTGHTGFKGSWLCAWLHQLDSKIVGFSNQQRTNPCHHELLHIPTFHEEGDICDCSRLQEVLLQYQPEIVFHLAAQSLVGRSYNEPLITFATNTLGTANLLQAVRSCDSVKAVIIITTDKVYENQESELEYKETDLLGGHDPYAVSKACSELVVHCFQRSFYEAAGILSATCRAGNALGGGDWAAGRLFPELMCGAANHKNTLIRVPHAVRPWGHVLDSLAGYLQVGQMLLRGHADFAQAWNFGPEPQDHQTVIDIAQCASRYWTKVNTTIDPHTAFHETTLLKLDSTKARRLLEWKPIWNVQKAVKTTVEWYRAFYESGTILTEKQLTDYIEDAVQAKATWTF